MFSITVHSKDHEDKHYALRKLKVKIFLRFFLRSTIVEFDLNNQ